MPVLLVHKRQVVYHGYPETTRIMYAHKLLGFRVGAPQLFILRCCLDRDDITWMKTGQKAFPRCRNTDARGAPVQATGSTPRVSRNYLENVCLEITEISSRILGDRRGRNLPVGRACCATVHESVFRVPPATCTRCT